MLNKKRPETDFVAAESGEELQLAPGHLWELQQGEVLVLREDRPVDIWRAPVSLDVGGFLSGRRACRFVAVTPVQAMGTPLTAVDSKELIEAMQQENQRLWGRVGADVLRDDDTYLELAAPVPGPWHFRRATAVALIVQGDPEFLTSNLPASVRLLPGSGGRYVLALTRFEGCGSMDARDSSQFSYHEVTPFIPVWSGLRGPAAFLPELYPDAHMATLLGREIHGFPKRTARIGFDDDGGHLIVDKRLALRVRFDRGVNITNAEALSGMTHDMTGSETAQGISKTILDAMSPDFRGRFSVLVHKRIGAPQSAGQDLEIDNLVRVPMLLDPIRTAQRLEGLVVDIPGGPGVLHGKVLSGWRMETGFRFGRGTVERRGASQ